MAVAIFLLIIVIVSVLLSFFSPWQFTEIASNWGYIDFTVILTFWICGIVFVLIGLFMVYTTWKFRYREDARADYEPENPRLEWWLTIVTTVGVVAMLAPGLIVWNDFVNPPDDVQEVEVLSKQWGWAFRFPGEDGKFGTVHVDNIDRATRCISRLTRPTRCCCARTTCCTTSGCRSSAPRWTPYRG